jgi:hypothetical protein
LARFLSGNHATLQAKQYGAVSPSPGIAVQVLPTSKMESNHAQHSGLCFQVRWGIGRAFADLLTTPALSLEPRKQAAHMAAPTDAANLKKALANAEPSTHGTKETSQLPTAMSGVEG